MTSKLRNDMKTKDRILAASIDLFRHKGYSGTGLKEVAAQAQAPWGSLYHFFPKGKEQLGTEVVTQAGAEDDASFQACFAANATPMGAIRQIFNAESKRLERSNYRDGCTVASVASDIAGTSDPVREACSNAFAAWQLTIQQAFVDSGRSKSESATMALFVLSCLEGATLLSRCHRSTAPFKANLKMIEAALT